MMPEPVPWSLSVGDGVLDDLYERVRRTRWTDSVEGSGWAHGTDIDYLRQLSEYWQDGFDWPAQQRLLNHRLPGWIVEVGGRRVHFARCRGVGPSPMPLVLLHGWPGSFAEMYKVAPMLADPAAHGGDPVDAFEVIVPSLPGHGFSDAVLREGFGADECADVVHTLMTDVLGLNRFGAQGGDRGAFVSAGLGHRHPDSVIGIHLNLATGILGSGDAMTEAERQLMIDQRDWLAEEGGYIAIQGTRPQSLGVALNDSPVGLLAWIVEKWQAWSDCGGAVESCFTKSELLTNATIYWVTETIRSSMHYYYEHRVRPPVAMRPERVDVPTGVAMFPFEVMRVPRPAVERKYDVRRWTDMPAGGHFAAMEQPEALVTEIRHFFRPLRPI
jgi:pimeloyl-ACP methyl ester carboxylesterase